MKFDIAKVINLVSDKMKSFARKLKKLWKKLGKTRIGGKIPANYLCTGLLMFCLLDMILLIMIVSQGNQEQKVKVEKADLTAHATLCTAGDVMLHSPFLSSGYYYDGENYDFHDIFKYIKDDYNSADYTVCTFEGVLSGEPYSGHPAFRSPDAIMTALKDSGIDLCLLGNNHIYDSFDAGLPLTMDAMERIEIDYLGIRRNVDTRNYTVVDINGIKVGMVDYVYETTSTTGAAKSINALDISNESAPLIHSFNYDRLNEFYAEIEECYKNMKAEGATFCIAYMHWGDEYQLQENADQDAMAQKMCDIGFGAIIGSHPHVIQPVDVLTSSDGSHKTLVAYAIGNHLSNQRTELMEGAANGETEDGYMLTLTLDSDENGLVSVTAVDYLPTWVYRVFDGNYCQYYILPLDDVEGLPELTGLQDLASYPQDSVRRTEAIIGSGMDKVQGALPITAKEEPVTEPEDEPEE